MTEQQRDDLEVLLDEPSPASWRLISTLFQLWDAGEARDSAMEYAAATMAQTWPDALRSIRLSPKPGRLFHPGLDEELRLARSLTVLERHEEIPSLLDSERVQRLVELELPADHLECLCRSRLPNVKHLRVRGNVNAEALVRLSGAGVLEELECLALHEGGIGAPEISLLGSACPRLTSLDLRDDIGVDGVRALVESGLYARLVALDLTSCRLGDDALAVLSDAACSPPRVLSVLNNRIGGAGMASIAQLEGLETLAASARDLGRDDLLRLSSMRSASSLRALRLDALPDGSAARLLSALSLPALRSLWLFDAPGGPDLSDGIARLTALEDLWLSDTHLGTGGMSVLARGPAGERLQRLVANELPVKIKAPAVAAIAECASHLVELRLLYSECGAEGARALADSPAMRGLRKLGLIYGRLGDQGAEALARSRHLERLEQLDLTACGIRSKGLRAFAKAEGLPALRVLDLTENTCPKAALRDLLHSGRNALRSLHLHIGRIQGEELEAIAKGSQLPKVQELDIHREDLVDSHMYDYRDLERFDRGLALAPGLPRAFRRHVMRAAYSLTHDLAQELGWDRRMPHEARVEALLQTVPSVSQ